LIAIAVSSPDAAEFYQPAGTVKIPSMVWTGLRTQVRKTAETWNKKNPPRRRVVGANQHHAQINSIAAVTRSMVIGKKFPALDASDPRAAIPDRNRRSRVCA
jgi:hypothetical protein